MIVTIDGPAGSGKSTVAREVAQRLNYYYIASGSLYRALSYVLIHYFGYSLKNINMPEPEDVQSALDPVRFKYVYNNAAGEKILFDGFDTSNMLKSELVTAAASIMATSGTVNTELIKYQRSLVHGRDVIIDGRNCGSEVFPHAQVKIYMTASVEVRAIRWQKVQEKLGNIISFAQSMQLINERDTRDSERLVAPLMVPAHALIIDTSSLDIKASVSKVIEAIQMVQ